MSALVSTFLDVSLGKGKYLFFLVAWTDYESNIKQELDKQWQPFGSHLGTDGTVIRAYDQHSNKTYQETLEKQWPGDVAQRMKKEQDPFLLIIDRSFDTFDPNEHKWSIVWLSDFSGEPQLIYRMFDALAKKVKEGGDVFGWAASLAQKQKYQKFAKYFQFKPGIFGATFDVKSALEDLAGVKN